MRVDYINHPFAPELPPGWVLRAEIQDPNETLQTPRSGRRARTRAETQARRVSWGELALESWGDRGCRL